MKTIEELLSGMEVREAYEFGRMAERLEMAREADARWEKAHAEVVSGFDRLIGMLEELPGNVLKAAVEAAEAGTEEVKRRLEAREWVKGDDEGVEDEQVTISLPIDVAMELERRRK